MIFGAIRTLAVLAEQVYHAGQLLLGGPQHPLPTRELPLDTAEFLAAVVAEQALTNTLLQDIRTLLHTNASAAPDRPPGGAADGPAAHPDSGAAGPLKPQ